MTLMLVNLNWGESEPAPQRGGVRKRNVPVWQPAAFALASLHQFNELAHVDSYTCNHE